MKAGFALWTMRGDREVPSDKFVALRCGEVAESWTGTGVVAAFFAGALQGQESRAPPVETLS